MSCSILSLPGKSIHLYKGMDKGMNNGMTQVQKALPVVLVDKTVLMDKTVTIHSVQNMLLLTTTDKIITRYPRQIKMKYQQSQSLVELPMRNGNFMRFHPLWHPPLDADSTPDVPMPMLYAPPPSPT